MVTCLITTIPTEYTLEACTFTGDSSAIVPESHVCTIETPSKLSVWCLWSIVTNKLSGSCHY